MLQQCKNPYRSTAERDQAGCTVLMEPVKREVPNCPEHLLWRNRLPVQILARNEKEKNPNLNETSSPSACL